MKTLAILLIVISTFISLNAQDTTTHKIALLPIISNGIDPVSVQTAESLLRMDLSNQNNLIVITENKTLDALGDEQCTDEECAKQIGEELDVERVLLCKLNPLGDKIIVQYILVETSTGKNLLSEQTTALSLEDLELVMNRVAISVSKLAPFDANQEVGNIVGKESVEDLRRASRFNFGIGFGYLYPSNGYDDDKKSFTLNGYFDYEIQDYSVGLMVGGRKGFAVNLYGNYLFSKSDICPYLGGALGFHWVTSHKNSFAIVEPAYSSYYNNPQDKTSDGIELGFETGIRILHTYNVQLFVKLEYIITFNEYDDRAFVFTIGIL